MLRCGPRSCKQTEGQQYPQPCMLGDARYPALSSTTRPCVTDRVEDPPTALLYFDRKCRCEGKVAYPRYVALSFLLFISDGGIPPHLTSLHILRYPNDYQWFECQAIEVHCCPVLSVLLVPQCPVFSLSPRRIPTSQSIEMQIVFALTTEMNFVPPSVAFYLYEHSGARADSGFHGGGGRPPTVGLLKYVLLGLRCIGTCG